MAFATPNTSVMFVSCCGQCGFTLDSWLFLSFRIARLDAPAMVEAMGGERGSRSVEVEATGDYEEESAHSRAYLTGTWADSDWQAVVLWLRAIDREVKRQKAFHAELARGEDEDPLDREVREFVAEKVAESENAELIRNSEILRLRAELSRYWELMRGVALEVIDGTVCTTKRPRTSALLEEMHKHGKVNPWKEEA